MPVYLIQLSSWGGSGGWVSARRFAYDTGRKRYWAVYRHQVGADYGIFAAYSDDDGATWHEETVVIIAGSAQEECTLAIDSVGNLHVAVSGYGHGVQVASRNVAYYERIAATDTWESEVVITDIANIQRAPAIAVDLSDDLHLIWVYNNGTNVSYMKRTSGVWGSRESVSGTPTWEAPSIAVAVDSTAHVAWYQAVVRQTYHRSRSPGGVWGATTTLSTVTGNHQMWPCIALDSSDEPHVVWLGLGWGVNTAKYQVVYRRRVSGVWQACELLTDTAVDNATSTVAINTDGEIHVLYFRGAIYQRIYSGGSWQPEALIVGGSHPQSLWGTYNVPSTGYGFGLQYPAADRLSFWYGDLGWGKPLSFAYVIG